MSLSTAITIPITSQAPAVRLEDQCLRPKRNVLSYAKGLKPLRVPFQSVERRNTTCIRRVKRSSLICAAALNATCAAEQTQTVTRQSSTIIVAPIQGVPPPNVGGGGGGGVGHYWSGGFFFFGFLAFLGLLKDKESESLPYQDA